MEAIKLAGLEPKAVLGYFEKLTNGEVILGSEEY